MNKNKSKIKKVKIMNENKTNINWDIRIFRKIDLNY